MSPRAPDERPLPLIDQRRYPRYAIDLDAEIALGPVHIAGRTRDISRGGFCMSATQEVAGGSPCRVRLALVFAENQFSEYLNLDGTIAWCTRVKEGFQIGVKFQATNPQQRSFLDLFIRFLDEGAEDDDDDDDDGDDGLPPPEGVD
jgi:hypothetical protein